MKRAFSILLGLGLVLTLVACGGKAPTAAELLSQAADAMAAVKSLQFTIERQGEAVVIDPDSGLAMLSAAGEYEAPESVHAKVKGEVMGMVTEADVLWLAEGIYFKLPPLFAQYTPIELESTFDAAGIFSVDTGIPNILKEQLDSPSLVGEETVEEFDTYHITAQAEGENLSNLVGAVVQSGTATVDIWIDKDAKYVVRILITEADGSGWQVDFFAFEEPVEIPSP